jgi:hypothetical protein
MEFHWIPLNFRKVRLMRQLTEFDGIRFWQGCALTFVPPTPQPTLSQIQPLFDFDSHSGR